ncbi:hypothetical protein EJ04DRAFT_576633 [Polyplosphaeria fusca]|uniref:Peptidase A2 domain-containing protein n=1 Tax=Polyplosphaeria fusca TaxID=682080 RepID=A0A9P4V2Z8_9PLEO|nr:hypothetical protein EJ04DRAFT_576633 [Polyplosphaeria fusca]
MSSFQSLGDLESQETRVGDAASLGRLLKLTILCVFHILVKLLQRFILVLYRVAQFYAFMTDHRHGSFNTRFQYNIHIEAMPNGHPVHCVAIALLDTGCELNIMSRRLAQKLGFDFSGATGTPMLQTFGGETINFVGAVEARWACTEIPKFPGIRFPLKYTECLWHVDTGNNEQFEVIIGSKVIAELATIQPFAAPAGRYREEKAEKNDMLKAEKKQSEDRKKNEERKKEARAKVVQGQAGQQSASQ